MNHAKPISSLHGSIDVLILKALHLGPLHGVGLFKRIQQITKQTIEISYGSLFPALHRMEECGYLVSEWQNSENNRRAKYYSLTATGRKQLGVEQREWYRLVRAITAVLDSE
jgi:transcriptional regulator